MLNCLQNSQPEQIELDQAHPLAIVLVPLKNRPILHASVFDGDDFTDGPVGEHHSSRMDTQMPRQSQNLLGELDHGCGEVFVAIEPTPPLDAFRKRVLRATTKPERAGDVSHRILGSVFDDGGDQSGIFSAVALVDVLDDFFAAI